MSPPYGVVMPARDAEGTIAEAIKSLLAQTVLPARIVVVDDGSSDATPEIARSFGGIVEIIRQAHQGPAAATDHGLARIDEALVAGLDADDVWFPEKAERQIAQLTGEPAVDGVFCHATVFAHGTRPDPGGRSHALWGRSAMMLRHEAVRRIGQVDCQNAPDTGEMIDWLTRGRELGLRFRILPDALVGRRRISGSLAEGQDAAALLPVVRAALRRKRRSSG
jgi:glycosyltransferase involved in cell wall biosynthesis